MTATDMTWLAGPRFSSVTAKVESVKPGQLLATSRQGIYAGLRDEVNGWMVIFNARPLEASVVSNMILDPKPRHGPLVLD